MNLNRPNSLHFYPNDDRVTNPPASSAVITSSGNTAKSRKCSATDRSEANSAPHKKQKTEPSTIHRTSVSYTGENSVRNISVVPPNALEVGCAAPPTLQEMPDELLLNIFSRLSIRDSVVIKSTFEAADRVVNDLLSKGSKRWFSRFSPLQQAKFNKIAEGTDEQVLRTWLGQFTEDEEVVIHLLENRQHCHFPELLFYTVSRLMADCQAFKVEQIFSIEFTAPMQETIFSDDGNHILSQSVRGQCKIYTLSPAGNWLEKTTICHAKRILWAQFSGDGMHVVTRSNDGQTKIHALKPDGIGIVEGNLPQGTHIEFAEFSLDGLRVAIIVNHTLRIFGRGTDGAWAEEGSFSDGAYHKPIFTRDGNELIVVVKDRLFIYRRGSNESWEKKDPLGNNAKKWVTRVSPDDSHMITIDRLANQSLNVFGRGANGEWMEQAVIVHKERVTSADFSPNSRYLVVAFSRDNHVIYHRAANGSWSKKATIDSNQLFKPVTFSYEGRYLAITTNDDKVKVYGLGAEGQCTETSRIYKARHAFFSTEGNHIFAYHPRNPDGYVRIYGLSQDGQLKLKAAFAHGHLICSASISPTGRYLVTNGYDAKTKIWLLCCGAENQSRSQEMVEKELKAWDLNPADTSINNACNFQ